MCVCVCAVKEAAAKCCGKLPADAANIWATSMEAAAAAADYVGHKSLSSTSCHIRRPGQPEGSQTAAIFAYGFYYILDTLASSLSRVLWLVLA